MWCSNCQQDVPGIAANERDSGISCARCGNLFGADISKSTPGKKADNEHPKLQKSSLGRQCAEWEEEDFADWDRQPATDLKHHLELQDDVQTVRRLHLDLTGHLPLDDPLSTCSNVQKNHLHPAVESSQINPNFPQNHPLPVAPMAKPSWGERIVYFASWSLMCVGLMALACGGALMIWAYLSGRGEIWPVGIPIAVVGQVLLMVGLIMQVDHLWYYNRRNVQASAALSQNLASSNQPVPAMHSGYPPPHFTASPELADSDSQTTLDEIKGRLDRLTTALNKDTD